MALCPQQRQHQQLGSSLYLLASHKSGLSRLNLWHMSRAAAAAALGLTHLHLCAPLPHRRRQQQRQPLKNLHCKPGFEQQQQAQKGLVNKRANNAAISEWCCPASLRRSAQEKNKPQSHILKRPLPCYVQCFQNDFDSCSGVQFKVQFQSKCHWNGCILQGFLSHMSLARWRHLEER